MNDLLWLSALVIVGYMVLGWLVSLITKDASIVDMMWGLGFVIVAWATYLRAERPPVHALILTSMVTIWGLRLSGYLTWRNLGKPEDYRYQEMRERAEGSFWLVSLFQVFLLQGALMWVVSVPVVFTQASDTALAWLVVVGLAVWLLGLVFESVGDVQLARFKRDPDSKGRVMDSGLWRYTRHPNYFGDFCVWWGIYLVAVAAGGWWTVFSPLLMSFLLLRVSGVAMLEKTITSRRPGYAEYAEQTNAFFPGRPQT